MHHGRGRGQRRDHGGIHHVGVHRRGDALDVRLPHVPERVRQLVADLITNHPRDADAARLGQCFQSSREIDAVAENVVLFDDYVTQVDPNSEADALVFGRIGIAVYHRCWISAAHRTASTTLPNSTSIPSPVFLTVWPWCSLTLGSTSSRRCVFRRSCVPSASSPINRE